MKKNKGFTLVELIVVLVILAILAAILIPAMLGYIDRAREKQEMLDAKACITAAQAELVELYAINGAPKAGDHNPVIPGTNPAKASTSGNADQEIIGSDFAKKVLQTADLTGDREPYLLLIGIGSNAQNTDSKTTAHDKFTVYYAYYMAKANSAPLYYYNGVWTKYNPRPNANSPLNNGEQFTSANVVKSGPLQGKRIQYYLIVNKSGKGGVKDGSFWNWLKDRE